MTTAETTSHQGPELEARGNTQPTSALRESDRASWIEPDLDFIRTLGRHAGDSFKKCFQCGTCSATCTLSPDLRPFPRKQMAWATWGRKDLLLKDPDVWLCHQCNDCSTRCPRGARPGDVLAAVRQESVRHCAAPRFLGRWMNQPQCIPLLLGIPAGLLTLALFVRGPIADALGIAPRTTDRIVYAYSSMFPHWLLNGFFALFGLLVFMVVVTGVARFWRSLSAGAALNGGAALGGISTLKGATALNTTSSPGKGLLLSIGSVLKNIITHHNFAECTAARSRFLSHLSVFFGFIALSLVSMWVVTARHNPLIHDAFVYPFGFWSPWKILANLGGLALIGGCLLMVWDRLKADAKVGRGTYFDWLLISKLILVTITGFITEVLHYLRLEPHRHIAYFVHLVFVCAVLMYLPYSKLAHLVYRAVAMVIAERSGRTVGGAPSRADNRQLRDREVRDDDASIPAAT